MNKAKKITLLLAFLMPLNVFSQIGDCSEFLYNAIRNIALPDMEEYMEQYWKQIMQDSNSNVIDSIKIIDLYDVVIISFNSKEYVELDGYNKENTKISRMRTRLNLIRIVNALDKDCTVRHDLFDSFIYRYSIRLENGFGWDAEYRIKMDDDGMRIIGREIYEVLESDN